MGRRTPYPTQAKATCKRYETTSSSLHRTRLSILRTHLGILRHHRPKKVYRLWREGVLPSLYSNPTSERRQALLLHEAYATARRKHGESMSMYHLARQDNRTMQQQHHRTYGQRELPPQRPASPQRVGPHAELHDESQPFYSGNLTRKQTGRHRPVQRLDRIQGEGENEYDDVWPPIAPSSAIRYTIPPGQYIQGNTRLNVRYEAPPAHQKHAIPRRSSYTEEEDIDELETQRPLNRSQSEGFHIHWMLFLGIGLLIAIGGWMAFSSF